MTTGYRIAADVGGTFTDIALVTPAGAVATFKLPSTPADFARAVVGGMQQLVSQLAIPFSDLGEVLHASTVATNAILEKKGARTAVITTAGFRDVLRLRRVRVPRLYDPLFVKPEPLVPRRLCLEVRERIDPLGQVVEELDEEDVSRAIALLRAHAVEAVAICLLHAYANPAHEHRVAAQVAAALPDCFVSVSSDILPERGEYERTSTTVINAYVGPPVRRYIASLVARQEAAGSTAPLSVMQSSGGMLGAAAAMERPALMVESGPAAGVIAAAHLGRLAGCPDLISFDMGGTTAKAAMIEAGQFTIAHEYDVGSDISANGELSKGSGYALRTPTIDIAEIGAGGGSRVWLDTAGALKVGPESMGAVPGPACYGAGNTLPTVTDANLVLGYIGATSLAGASLRVDPALAEAAIATHLAAKLDRSVLDTAYGVHLVAVANMSNAVKSVTTFRGRDPRAFTLMAFGGNGGIHAAQLAGLLKIRRVLVPPRAGVLSALGLLVARVELTLSKAVNLELGTADVAVLHAAARELEARVIRQIGGAGKELAFIHSASLRYRGQASELTVKLGSGRPDRGALDGLRHRFETAHEQSFGHRLSGARLFEIINLYVQGTIVADRSAMDLLPPGSHGTPVARPAYFGPRFGLLDTAVIRRGMLSVTPRAGPLIIEDDDCSTVVPPDATACLDVCGNIDLALPAVPRDALG